MYDNFYFQNIVSAISSVNNPVKILIQQQP